MPWDDLYNVNDTYKIKKDLEDIKKFITEIEKDISRFLGNSKIMVSGTRARSKIRKLRKKMLPAIAEKILKKRQDYESDYS